MYADTSRRRASSSSSSSPSLSTNPLSDTHSGHPPTLTRRIIGPSVWGFASGQACLLGMAVGGDLLHIQGASSGLLKYLPQLIDNATHAIIAALVWYTAIIPDGSLYITRGQAYKETIGALMAGSFVDLDHFAAARSGHMKDALNLSSRPLGHCVTTVVIESVIVYLLSEATSLGRGRGLRNAILVFSSAISHQLRDSTRRGMWFCPVGSTPKLPYVLYLCILGALPVLVRMSLVSLGGRVWTEYSELPIAEVEIV